MVSTQLLLSSCRTHHGEFFLFPRILPYLHLSLRLLHNFWCFCGKTFGVFVVNHNDSVYFAILVFSDMFWARVANGSCPSGASTLPNRGKHRAHVGQAPCPFSNKKRPCLHGIESVFHFRPVDIAEGCSHWYCHSCWRCVPGLRRGHKSKKETRISRNWHGLVFTDFFLIIFGKWFLDFGLDLVGFASAGTLPFCLWRENL